MMPDPKIYFVDVDDTMVRSAGTSKIPIPATILAIKRLKGDGAILYCWSSGGAEYAESIAKELGVHACFTGFLPKPHVVIDDQNVEDWTYLQQIHPNSL